LRALRRFKREQPAFQQSYRRLTPGELQRGPGGAQP
jgi:hypothetical protein